MHINRYTSTKIWSQIIIMVNPSQLVLEVGTGLLHSHDPWAGGGTVGWQFESMWHKRFCASTP